MPQTVTQSKRVLVVDDEPKFREIVAEFLGAQGHVVATASDGLEALNQMGWFQPDVVLLDLAMPRLSGLQTIELLRARLTPPRLIMVSAADPDAEEAQCAMRRGAEAYVCKPINLTNLHRLIAGVWPSEPAPA